MTRSTLNPHSYDRVTTIGGVGRSDVLGPDVQVWQVPDTPVEPDLQGRSTELLRREGGETVTVGVPEWRGSSKTSSRVRVSTRSHLLTTYVPYSFTDVTDYCRVPEVFTDDLLTELLLTNLTSYRDLVLSCAFNRHLDLGPRR